MRTVSQHPLNSRGLPLDSSRPEDVIAYLLKSLHHSLRQVMAEALRRRRIDMSFAHFVTLYTLDAEPGVAGAELARRGFVTAQTMNTMLRRLEQDGDIERHPHPVNMRADSWYVTKAGQAKLERAKVVGAEVWRRTLSGLKAGEFAQLQSLLERCIGGLDAQLGEMRGGQGAQANGRTRRVNAARSRSAVRGKPARTASKAARTPVRGAAKSKSQSGAQ